MTESINEPCKVISNGIYNETANGQTKNCTVLSIIIKPPRKKVSFKENVTDIDEELIPIQNGFHLEQDDAIKRQDLTEKDDVTVTQDQTDVDDGITQDRDEVDIIIKQDQIHNNAIVIQDQEHDHVTVTQDQVRYNVTITEEHTDVKDAIMPDRDEVGVTVMCDQEEDGKAVFQDREEDYVIVIQNKTYDDSTAKLDQTENGISVIHDRRENVVSVAHDRRENAVSVAHDQIENDIFVTHDKTEKDISVTYDQIGNGISITHDQRENTVSVAHDQIENDIFVIQDKIEKDISVTHDQIGNVISITHDQRENRISITQDITKKDISVTYDQIGNGISITQDQSESGISVTQVKAEKDISVTHDQRENGISVTQDTTEKDISVTHDKIGNGISITHDQRKSKISVTQDKAENDISVTHNQKENSITITFNPTENGIAVKHDQTVQDIIIETQEHVEKNDAIQNKVFLMNIGTKAEPEAKDVQNQATYEDIQPEVKGGDEVNPPSDIVNVSQKIKFFKSAFQSTSTKGGLTKPHGHQTSIPEARLAFVTRMVESTLTGSFTRADPFHVVDQEADSEPHSSPSSDQEDMATVTFAKIFATHKIKGDAAVDTSSILEHREEIRELWEKRMMADDNQSSPSSAAEKSKPSQEEGSEEEVVKTKAETQIPNGIAKHVEGNSQELVSGEAKAYEEAFEDTENNAPDSLEIDNNHIEEKIYTSKLETSLTVKPKANTEVDAPDAQEGQLIDFGAPELKVESQSDGHSSEEYSGGIVEMTAEQVMAAMGTTDEVEAPAQVKEHDEQVLIPTEDNVVKELEKEEVHEEEVTVEEIAVDQKPSTSLELEINIKETDGDGFVSVEECLLTVGEDDVSPEEEKQSLDDQHPVSHVAEQKPILHNGHSSPAVSITPEPDSKPATQPEMEAFVKSGGVKRILPGVQKTEQPYSSCTTETKIAMEIREMREREEELRLMRERALTSPPPPSPAKSPSPLPPKEAPSPTPSGTGYKVSSVFGRGSPVMESAKGLQKESAVEKEIRMARDREEELRKQKGLPPREDDTYVKPSQVKSSQVRVFGRAHTSMKQAATAKIQLEIEEQTQREMALRETGSIQTISQERTDAKVAKLGTPEEAPHTNGHCHAYTNGNTLNGRSSPSHKTVSSTLNGGPRPASIFSQGKTVNMHKFIASKGKSGTNGYMKVDTNGTSTVPKSKSGTNGFAKTEDKSKSDVEIPANVPPAMLKLKRTVSVESKIQQEILEMKQREEELKLLHHMNQNEDSPDNYNGNDNEMNHKNIFTDYGNGNGYNDEDISPRHNKLIAQWEQRIQKSES